MLFVNGGEMEYPRIYLAIDNCFASKRWTRPHEWMKVIKDIGLDYIEASADNECDPLYMGEEYLCEWTDKVIENSAKYGVKVANLYSGHGTYATLGLSHTDVRIRNRILNEWLKPMARNAGKLGAGLGFFCHAFPNCVLQDIDLYAASENDLVNRLAELAEYSRLIGCRSIGIEQMYTPHQIPWTIRGAREMIEKIYRKSGQPFYITIDVGHQSGQRKFLKPDKQQIKKLLESGKSDISGRTWLGPETAWNQLEKAQTDNSYSKEIEILKIESEIDKYPYMFAEYVDGDPYTWIEQLGSYSPIIHLQQTSGKSSSHLPFTKDNNENGIIDGRKVLDSIFNSYRSAATPDMPERCSEIYLTIEIFAATSEKNSDLLKSLKESVMYWRNFVPKDGLTLDKLVSVK